MGSKYALIDFENVQPTSLKKLKTDGYHLRIFIGASQSKISVELAADIQQFGEKAQYVRLQNSGKNALDFHIAFYLGQLTAKNPDCQLLVVSKDTGYDPLLAHMRSIGIKAQRSTAGLIPAPELKAAPAQSAKATTTPKTPQQMTLNERVNFAKTHFKTAGKAKPAKVSSLAADLHSKFQKKLSDLAIQDLIKELIKQGIVIDTQGSITYQLTP